MWVNYIKKETKEYLPSVQCAAPSTWFIIYSPYSLNFRQFATVWAPDLARNCKTLAVPSGPDTNKAEGSVIKMLESQPSKHSITCTFSSLTLLNLIFFPHKTTYFPQIDDIPPLDAFLICMQPGVSCEPQAKAGNKHKPVGPHRSVAGGEFPDYFSGAWKRLICWKQRLPKTLTELHAEFGWKCVTAAASASSNRCWLAWFAWFQGSLTMCHVLMLEITNFHCFHAKTSSATGLGSHDIRRAV